MKRAALYARVSTEKQAEKELSIPAQLQELKEYAAKNEMEVVAAYTDEGISAKTDDRPEFQRMIAEAKQKPKPFDVILCHKNDRFARNREDAIVYKSLLRRDCGIEFIAIKEDFGDGPVAKMIEGILEVIAEFYSLNLAQEVRKGMKEKAKQGKALGETPLGYTIGPEGYYKIVPEEAKVVEYIFNEYVNTDKGLRSIANDLRAKGKALFGEAGNKYKWSANGIKVLLTNKAYTGTLVWNKRDASKNYKIRDEEKWITVPNAHEPIVSKDIFKKAQETLKSKRTKRSDSKDYLLRGLVKCMDCGSNMSQFSYKWKRKDGTRMESRQFRCSEYMHSGDCYFNHVAMEDIENNLFDYLDTLLEDDVDLSTLNIAYEKNEHLESALKIKQQDLKNIDRRFERQMMAFENGVIDLSHLKKFKVRLKSEKEELINEIEDLEDQVSKEQISLAKLQKKVADVIKVVRNKKNPLRKRRESLKTILNYVEYSRNKDDMAVHIKI